MTTPSIGSIALDKLPKAGRGSSELSVDDKALAQAIAKVANDGSAAVIHVTYKTREDAGKAASRTKRMLKRSNVVPDGKAPRLAVVPMDDGKGFEIAVHFGEPVAARGSRKPKTEG